MLIGTTTFQGLMKLGEDNVLDVDIDGVEEDIDQEERLLEELLFTAGEVGADVDGLRVYEAKSKDAGKLKWWLVVGADVWLLVM